MKKRIELLYQFENNKPYQIKEEVITQRAQRFVHNKRFFSPRTLRTLRDTISVNKYLRSYESRYHTGNKTGVSH